LAIIPQSQAQSQSQCAVGWCPAAAILVVARLMLGPAKPRRLDMLVAIVMKDLVPPRLLRLKNLPF